MIRSATIILAVIVLAAIAVVMVIGMAGPEIDAGPGTETASEPTAG